MKPQKINFKKTEQEAFAEDFNMLIPYFPKKETQQIKIRLKKRIYTYMGAANLCFEHNIKQKNMWQKYITQKGFEIVSIDDKIITNNLDRPKMIRLLLLKHKRRNNELLYLKDEQLYNLWKKLTFKN